MLADTRPAQQTYFRYFRTTRPTSSDSPKPSDPWPPPAGGKVVHSRSVPPVEVRVPENVLEPPALALIARRATAIVPRPGIGHPLSECCRSCRALNKDWVPSPGYPSKARKLGHSRPSVRTIRRAQPCLLQTWHNLDSRDRATPGPLRNGRRECTPPPMPAAHSHTPDDLLLPSAPAQSRDRAHRARCTPSPAPRWHTDYPDTAIARARAAANRCSSTPVAQVMRPHNQRTTRRPRMSARPAHSIA